MVSRRFFFIYSKYLRGRRVRGHQFAGLGNPDEFPRLKAWFDKIVARPAVQIKLTIPKLGERTPNGRRPSPRLLTAYKNDRPAIVNTKPNILSPHQCSNPSDLSN